MTFLLRHHLTSTYFLLFLGMLGPQKKKEKTPLLQVVIQGRRGRRRRHGARGRWFGVRIGDRPAGSVPLGGAVARRGEGWWNGRSRGATMEAEVPGCDI